MPSKPPARTLRVGQKVRYPKSVSAADQVIDGLPNFHYLMQDPVHPDSPALQMESGVDAPALTRDLDDASRRAVVFARTSTHKAGSTQTPWHDEYDVANGRIVYFGDHKPTTTVALGATGGNSLLLEASELQRSSSVADRLSAPPILVFRFDKKGMGTFCGVAVISDLQRIVQSSNRPFQNLVANLIVLDAGVVDLRWIDHRRDPGIRCAETLTLAPLAWQIWVQNGSAALDDLRISVPV